MRYLISTVPSHVRPANNKSVAPLAATKARSFRFDRLTSIAKRRTHGSSIEAAANDLFPALPYPRALCSERKVSIMKLVGSALLVLALVANVTAQTNWIDVTTESAEQGAPGLKIVKARARQDAMQTAENTRAFSIVVENTGERPIKSIDFLFDVTDESSVLASDANGNRIRCGFIIADLDINPGDVVTLERKLSGDHCIPLPSSKQVVRVQRILYADGSTWQRPGYQDSDWKRVKTPKAISPDSNQR
jgi:hypothetical protein